MVLRQGRVMSKYRLEMNDEQYAKLIAFVNNSPLQINKDEILSIIDAKLVEPVPIVGEYYEVQLDSDLEYEIYKCIEVKHRGIRFSLVSYDEIFYSISYEDVYAWNETPIERQQ